jgi:superfamily II DNA or RNA helicase
MTRDEIQAQITNKTLEFFKKDRFGYIDGTVRLGKIKITIDVLKSGFESNETILLAYPDNRIKDSWLDDFSKWKYENPNITFCNFSSLWKYENEIFGLILIDEFHDSSDNERDSLQIIMTNSPKTKCLALSGSVSKETKEIWGLKEIAKYTTLDGIRDGIISDYTITVHLVDLDTKVRTPNKKGKMLTEKQKYDNYTWVINKARELGKNTMPLALARNRLSLGSIGKINFTRKLLEELKDKRTIVFTGLSDVADELRIPSYHSKSTSNASFLAFQGGKINQLALAQMAKMGVTFPKLECVILLNFTYNKEDSLQQLGRCLELSYKDKIADLRIICLNEKPELKKVQESLSMLDKTKIKYV